MPSNESRHCEHYLQSFNGLLSTDMMNASKIGRVAAGSYPPAAPTDPGVPHSGTRLLR